MFNKILSKEFNISEKAIKIKIPKVKIQNTLENLNK